MRKVAWIATALVLALGCKGNAKKEEAPDEEARKPTGIIAPMKGPERPASVTDQHMQLIDRLGAVAAEAEKIVLAHTGDCDASAAALVALAEKSKADVAAAEAELAKLAGDKAATAYIKAQLGAKLVRGTQLLGLLEMCKGHKGVIDALNAVSPLVGMGDAKMPQPAGGGWSGARPPGVTDAQVAAIDAAGRWFEGLSVAAEQAKGNCASMAKALEKAVAVGKDLSKTLKETQKDVPARSAEDEWLGQYTSHKMDMKRFILAVGACQQDPAVKKALEGLNQ